MFNIFIYSTNKCPLGDMVTTQERIVKPFYTYLFVLFLPSFYYLYYSLALMAGAHHNNGKVPPEQRNKDKKVLQC